MVERLPFFTCETSIEEVYYDFIGEDGQRKRYFGAGWQNDSGGYDIRQDTQRSALRIRIF